MFRKPHRTKSNTKLKSSERKKFLSKILEGFVLNEEQITSLFPSKEAVTSMKIISHASEIISIYICEDIPLVFELEEYLYPTLFLLWKIPSAVPYITIHAGVMYKLFNGADLMVPGIVPNQSHLKINDYPSGTIVYINVENNMAAVAVGITLLNSSEMVTPGAKGKAVRIYHVFGDELCKLHHCKGIPDLKFPSDEVQSEEIGTDLTASVSTIHLDETPETAKDVITEESEDPLTMDELLHYAFIKALKKSSSCLPLPMLTNIFYKKIVLDAVPKNMSLDLKKTKYKKLSVFLSEMQQNGVLTLEDNKGVQSIISVNFNHEIFYNCVDKYKEEEVIQNEEPLASIQIVEKKVINGAVDKVFVRSNYRKGDCLTDQEVRKCITDYVKNENLQDPNSKQYINLNGILCDVLQTKDLHISWKDLIDTIHKKMGTSYEIRLPDNQVISGKGKLPLIELSVATKTSNKKVTMVNNLELYGINLNEFSKECQHGVAASSTINTLPSSKSAQFQIQGNQKKFIGKLLQEKYGIPKKCIQGLEEKKTKKS